MQRFFSLIALMLLICLVPETGVMGFLPLPEKHNGSSVHVRADTSAHIVISEHKKEPVGSNHHAEQNVHVAVLPQVSFSPKKKQSSPDLEMVADHDKHGHQQVDHIEVDDVEWQEHARECRCIVVRDHETQECVYPVSAKRTELFIPHIG